MAHNKRRNPYTWGYDVNDDQEHLADGITWTPTTRGFADHEQLRAVGLVHMNGRVFDPHIGRMISADPLVPHPLRAQSFNRYSYTQNNPLSRTDPSGYSDFTDNPIPANPSGVPEPADVPLRHFSDFVQNRTDPSFADQVDEWLKGSWDAEIVGLDDGCQTTDAVLKFSDGAEVPADLQVPGELFELLDGYRVIGLGRVTGSEAE